MKTIKREVLRDKVPTDNVTFRGGTHRIGIEAGWDWKTCSNVKLARTLRGGPLNSEFITYRVFD